MRNTLAVAVAAAVTVATMGSLDTHAKGSNVTLTPAADMKWTDVEGFPGVRVAALRGDPAKGANHVMLKLPAGFAAPLHHHSADHYVTVVTGTLVLNVDGKDTKLPAGSYFAFTGKKQHLTRCEAGGDCTLFIDNRAKWDVVPAGDKAAPAKKK
jgi:quercetin dioxygenase-like cupin family protein